MLNTETALAVLTPQIAIERAKTAYQIVKELREAVLVLNVDYGAIPGTDKPTLLKPGAEKMCRAFNYCPKFEPVAKVELWDADKPLFHYEIRCTLVRIDDGKEIATGVGSCNSMENKYRWRWVDEDEVPPGLDKSELKSRKSTRSEYAFAIEKAETGGQYGKPAEYWQEWKDAILEGKARKIYKTTRSGKQSEAWEMGSAVYRIPNDEVFSLVNTIEKMASKRALIAAVLIGTNASEFFTQDIEDLRDFGGDVVDAEFEVVTEPPPVASQATAEPPTSSLGPGIIEGEKNPMPAAYGKLTGKEWTQEQWTVFWSLVSGACRNAGVKYTEAQKHVPQWIKDGKIRQAEMTVEQAVDVVVGELAGQKLQPEGVK